MKKKKQKRISERILLLDDVAQKIIVRIKTVQGGKNDGFINIHDEEKSYPISHHVD